MRREHFEDDGASFRVRRIAQLQSQMNAAAFRNTPTFRLIRAMFWFIVPFLLFFVGTVIFAIITTALGAGRETVIRAIGQFEICKVDDEMGVDYHRAFTVPVNFQFQDFGPGDGDFMDKWDLTIQLIKPAVFKKDQRCATVDARIADDCKVRRVAISDDRHFEVLGPADPDEEMPDIAPWGNTPTLIGHVKLDFK